MSLYNLVLPLLMAFALTFANRFWGGSLIHYPKGVNPDGFHEVEFRFKQTFDSCDFLNLTCFGDCGTLVSQEKGVIYNTDGRNAVNFNWCQTESVVRKQIPHAYVFSLRDGGCCWTNLTNNLGNWSLQLFINLGNRSDTHKTDRPAVTTSISFLRIPQNCPRTFKLMMFDKDEDQVKCYINHDLDPGFILHQTKIKEKDFCTVSYSNAPIGVYGVELNVYGSIKQDISITYRIGGASYTFSLSKGFTLAFLQLLFTVKVDPAVASCDEGVYLPKFLPPTPETGDQIKAVIRKELQIIVKATASAAGVRDIIISGPLNTTVEKSNSSSEEFILSWTPRSEDLGEYFPICFIAESNQVNNTSYQSDMRCIIVEVVSETLVGLRLKVRSKASLTQREIEDTLLKFHEELIHNGLPNTTTLSLRRVHKVNP